MQVTRCANEIYLASIMPCCATSSTTDPEGNMLLTPVEYETISIVLVTSEYPTGKCVSLQG